MKVASYTKQLFRLLLWCTRMFYHKGQWVSQRVHAHLVTQFRHVTGWWQCGLRWCAQSDILDLCENGSNISNSLSKPGCSVSEMYGFSGH